MTTTRIPGPDDAPEVTEATESFQKMMDDIADSTNSEISNLAKHLDISEMLASEIWYLRTRSRHRKRTEDRMILCYRETGQDDFRTLAGEEEEELATAGY
jgi:hypothetical protein